MKSVGVKLFERAWIRLRDERGQGMTEYVLVATLTMVPLIVLFLPTMQALRVYLRGIYSFIALPIP
ncbi:MAG: hypothetical protein ACREQJ_01760 [Candidatus Binatia bacterium]